MRRILDADGNTIRTFHFDDATGRATVQTTQDVTAIVDHNREFQKTRQTGDFRKLASIPTTEYYRWMVEDGLGMRELGKMTKQDRTKWLRRRLNDPDFRGFKSTAGRV